MPLITIKPPRPLSADAQSPRGSLSSKEVARGVKREQSPEAPPASPLTPIFGATDPASNIPVPDISQTNGAQQSSHPPSLRTHDSDTNSMPPAQLIDLPPPLPFSGEDSTDAIALRAAISSLQFQRARAQKDLHTLEQIKRQAVERPEEFRQHIIQSASSPAAEPTWVLPPDGDDSDTDSISQMTSPPSRPNPTSDHSFPAIPEAQNVVRCPPIEWAKYHVVGEALEKLHMEQQDGTQGTESVIAGPYNPFVDRLSSEESSTKEQMQEGRKDSGASAAEQATHRRRSSKGIPPTD